MSYQPSEESQMVYCDKCGNEILVPIIKQKHRPKGSGSDYTVQNLHEDHRNALLAMGSLGATDIYHRKTLKAITKEFAELKLPFPVRNGIGGRLSELANINLQFVAWYSPKKSEKTDDNPTWRNCKLAGWYMKERGMQFYQKKLDYINGQFIEITDNPAWRLDQVLWENGFPSKRLVPVIEK